MMVDMLLDAASYSLSFSASSQRLVFALLDSHPDFFLCLLSSPCRFPLSAGSKQPVILPNVSQLLLPLVISCLLVLSLLVLDCL